MLITLGPTVQHLVTQVAGRPGFVHPTHTLSNALVVMPELVSPRSIVIDNNQYMSIKSIGITYYRRLQYVIGAAREY